VIYLSLKERYKKAKERVEQTKEKMDRFGKREVDISEIDNEIIDLKTELDKLMNYCETRCGLYKVNGCGDCEILKMRAELSEKIRELSRLRMKKIKEKYLGVE
jgi:predicted RNase H-like nuclease (RuvC/YqgF family)